MPWSRSSTTTHHLLVDANRVIGFDVISVMAVSPSTRRWALVSWCVTTLEAVADHIFACRGGASDEVLGSAICWWDADLTGEEAVWSCMRVWHGEECRSVGVRMTRVVLELGSSLMFMLGS